MGGELRESDAPIMRSADDLAGWLREHKPKRIISICHSGDEADPMHVISVDGDVQFFAGAIILLTDMLKAMLPPPSMDNRHDRRSRGRR